jgi:uncharacterized protein (TIGR02453 family)
MSDFDGFSPEAMQFLADLQANNSREWFNAHKQVYQEAIVEPALVFVVALGERLRAIYPDINADTRTNGAGSLMRIYRDTRFSKDKTPYKTNVGIVWWQGEGKKMEQPGFYFHLAPESSWVGGGLYMFPPPALEAFRAAVDDPAQGAALQGVLDQLQAEGLRVWGERYKRVPQGYSADHPRADLLKYKGLFAASSDFPAAVLASPGLVDQCFEICATQAPLQQWLLQNL